MSFRGRAAAGITFGANQGSLLTVLTDGGNLTLATDGAHDVVIQSNDAVRIAGATIGFFGAAGVAQPAHPVVLADVINALTNLGLTQ